MRLRVKTLAGAVHSVEVTEADDIAAVPCPPLPSLDLARFSGRHAWESSNATPLHPAVL